MLIYQSYGSLFAWRSAWRRLLAEAVFRGTAARISGRTGPAEGIVRVTMIVPTMGDRAAESRRRHEEAVQMGGPEAVDKHRGAGRLPVRERIALIVDEGSWFETGALALPERRTARKVPGDGVVTGFGRVDGRTVAIIGIDATVLAGTTAPVSMRKQGRLIEQAQRFGYPLVLLCDADGGRMPDVMGWRFSGLPLDFRTFLGPKDGVPPVPRAAAVLGPSYGDSALHASTAHFVVMVRSGSIALSGPSVVEASIGEQISDQELGGPQAAQAAGNVHMIAETEAEALGAITRFLSYLPSSAASPAPIAPRAAPAADPTALASIVPAASRSAYDMRKVLEAIADADSVFPWGAGWGKSLITALARVEGHPVGIVANQPLVAAGALDPAALAKETKFVDLCDIFNVPLVFLHDVPGLMIGTRAEQGGILHAYERVVTRIAAARVPKIGVVLRKAYGGGHFAMGGRPTHPDFLFAWPSAELGFMAPETGIRTVHRRKMEAVVAEQGPEARDALVAELMTDWMAESEPWEAAAHLSLDDVIEPGATRDVIARALELAWGSRGRRVVREWIR
jgi:acetyl-CoA carboxylase carboxyltransferase component